MLKKAEGLYIIPVLYKDLKSLGRWTGKLTMVDATKTTAHPIGHMTYTQVPAAVLCEKKTFLT